MFRQQVGTLSRYCVYMIIIYECVCVCKMCVRVYILCMFIQTIKHNSVSYNNIDNSKYAYIVRRA